MEQNNKSKENPRNEILEILISFKNEKDIKFSIKEI